MTLCQACHLKHRITTVELRAAKAAMEDRDIAEMRRWTDYGILPDHDPRTWNAHLNRMHPSYAAQKESTS
ncbi:MAG: hypothetical protein NVS9B4_00370 [Candidatus Acidiferrum sp.]